MLLENGVDQLLSNRIGCGTKSERNRPQAKLEQPVAAAGLQVVVPFGRRRRNELNLTGIEAEALVDYPGLRLNRPVVREEDPLGATLDDGRRDRAARDIGQRLSC